MEHVQKKLTTIELISQQALEISRLNYNNTHLNDELTDIWHPEFGLVWLHVETINDLIDAIVELNEIYKFKCSHDTNLDPDCLSCEIIETIILAKRCVSDVLPKKVERIH